jgi:DNA helicase-2/ATP-dependent DNA helicase PcrA
LPEIIEKVLAPQCAGGKHSGVLSSLKGLLQSINSKTMLPAGQLQQAINHYGPLMEAKYQKDPSRRKELLMLQQMALRYDSLKEFLADVAVDPDKDAHDTDLEFLTLSTVHSAKGLEWGTVFLIGLLDGVFPSGKSMLDDAGGDIEEERRLFYVAVTRAKDQLFLSLYNKSGPGGNSVSALSRFLEAENVKKTVDERKVRAAFVPVRNRAKRESRHSGR